MVSIRGRASYKVELSHIYSADKLSALLWTSSRHWRIATKSQAHAARVQAACAKCAGEYARCVGIARGKDFARGSAFPRSYTKLQ